MSPLTIIVAATKANGIGVNGGLPWRLSKELKYFAQATTAAPEGQQNAVIMGRNTWESIPGKFRPLPRRQNIVVSRNANYDLGTNSPSARLTHSLKSGLEAAQSAYRAFIIGGARLYSEAIALPVSGSGAYVERILLTRIVAPAFDECDTYLEDIVNAEQGGKRVWMRAAHEELETWVGFAVAAGEQEENGVKYEFQMWVRA